VVVNPHQPIKKNKTSNHGDQLWETCIVHNGQTCPLCHVAPVAQYYQALGNVPSKGFSGTLWEGIKMRARKRALHHMLQLSKYKRAALRKMKKRQFTTVR
jgi:hypothetical protein